MLIAGGVGLLIFFPQLTGWLAARAARGAGSVVVDTASGVVVGIAEGFGIPPTDAAKCEAAIAAGDHYAASKYCPAGTFLKDALGDIWDTVTGALVGSTEPSGTAEIVRIVPPDSTLPGTSPGTDANIADVWAA